MEVAVYARVSTESENQLNSLKNQQSYYLDYCREKGYKLTDIYADEGLTGTNMKREEFLRMLHDAGLNMIKDDISTRFIISNRKPKFEYIITKDVSRFARNTNVMEVVKLLREKGVYLLFQNANIDTKDDNYQFLLNMFLNFAQQESIDRSQKVKFGLKQRARQGKLHFGSERLFGYGYDKDSKEIYLIQNEAEIVQKMFELYTVDKLGSRQIADLLNSKGYKTQNDKIWNANAVVRILKNEKYTGNVHLLKYSYGDVTKENRQKKLTNEKNWEYKQDLIPSIITVETYQLAMEIMESRSGERGKNTPKNIYSKKIKCVKCGKNYIRTSQIQKGTTYYFYACATRRRTKECDNNSVTLKRLEKELQPYCDGLLYEILVKRKNTLCTVIDTHILGLQTRMGISVKRKDELHNSIQDKENEINKLLDSFLDSSDMVKKAVERKIDKIETERKELESELLKYEDKSINSEMTRLKETKEYILKSSQQKTFTMEEVLSFVYQIKVDGDKLDIEFTFDKLLPKANTAKEFLFDYGKDMLSILGDIKSIL